LRETVFNVLQRRIAGAEFADLYAGSGAVGLEALSRGARRVHFVENAKAAVAALRKNAGSLGLKEGVEYRVEVRGVEAALRAMAAAEMRYDIVFLDPPYEPAAEYGKTLRLLGSLGVLAVGAVVVAEHARRQVMPVEEGSLVRYRLLEQGDAALSFYSEASLAGE
jgi:16S rRNA (guanine(966)-N(2))-methyltransferase RsmD